MGPKIYYHKKRLMTQSEDKIETDNQFKNEVAVQTEFNDEDEAVSKNGSQIEIEAGKL